MKLAAAVLVAGSALFQLGAFLPVSRFYMASVQERTAIMQDQPLQWMLHLAGMGLGAVVAAVGLGLLALRLPRGTPSTLGLMTVVLVTVGTLLWIWHLWMRIADPAGFASGANPMWHFAAYTVGMQAGLLLLAAAFRQAGLPNWMVLVLAGGSLLTVLALVLFRDVPPFAHYVWLLAVGIGLLLAADPADSRSEAPAQRAAPDVRVAGGEAGGGRAAMFSEGFGGERPGGPEALESSSGSFAMRTRALPPPAALRGRSGPPALRSRSAW
jgi:hypothetical protein